MVLDASPGPAGALEELTATLAYRKMTSARREEALTVWTRELIQDTGDATSTQLFLVTKPGRP